MTAERGVVSPDLSEEEVIRRLEVPMPEKVVEDLYTFGQALGKETIDRVRALETKAVSLAAYGAAIVTLLAANNGFLKIPEDNNTTILAALAGFCGLMCVVYAMKVLALRRQEWISEEDWIKEMCLADVSTLQRFRVLTIWGALNSHRSAQVQKSKEFRRSQGWLVGAGVYMVYLLLYDVLIRFECVVKGKTWGFGGEPYWNYGGALLLGVTLAWVAWRSFRAL